MNQPTLEQAKMILADHGGVLRSGAHHGDTPDCPVCVRELTAVEILIKAHRG